MTDRYVVISADMHAGATVQGYKPYLASRWHAEFDAWAATVSSRWTDDSDASDVRCRYDSAYRESVLEEQGICAEVFFPDTQPPFYPSNAVFASQPRTREDYERRFAGLQAHNRWTVDFCAATPGRRKAPVQIFLFDIDDAVAEIRWGAEHGSCAVLVPAVAPNHVLEGLWSERYDPIWSVCHELGLAVNQHIGAGTPDIGAHPADGAALMYEVHWFARRSLWHMIFGGVFERFPDLKMVMTEEGLGWALPELRRLDYYVANVMRGDLAQAKFGYGAIAKLSLTPTEYFHRNVWIGASSLPPAEIGYRYEVGVDRIMWGADYPHPEGTIPYNGEALRATFAHVPEVECRRMLGENAAGIYGFDLDQLRAVADRIGPTTDEIATPLDSYPDGSYLPIYLGPLHPEPGALAGFSGAVTAV
ncbi:MAG TPA: amidohydrolase family protein [Acidimicrobiales bacterium]|jgi:predicted TIM-barrel fold metal-dependent hydrolase|nr:amidohydrolase family protein [Acidimicrobiales bacterium]